MSATTATRSSPTLGLSFWLTIFVGLSAVAYIAVAWVIPGIVFLAASGFGPLILVWLGATITLYGLLSLSALSPRAKLLISVLAPAALAAMIGFFILRIIVSTIL
jgi:hypothetical protein